MAKKAAKGKLGTSFSIGKGNWKVPTHESLSGHGDLAIFYVNKPSSNTLDRVIKEVGKKDIKEGSYRGKGLHVSLFDNNDWSGWWSKDHHKTRIAEDFLPALSWKVCIVSRHVKDKMGTNLAVELDSCHDIQSA